MPDVTPLFEDGPVGPSKSRLDIAERIAKIFAIVAIPVVIPIALAVYSARVQGAAQSETVNRDYVQLAVSLLKEKKNDLDPGIRDWAVDLLAEHSPTKFKPEVIATLKSGDVQLPTQTYDPYKPYVSVVSPTRKVIAHADAAGIRVFEVGTQRTLFSFPTQSMVNDLDFSPDGSLFVAGSQDGTVTIYKTFTGHLVESFKIGLPLTTVHFDGPDKVVAQSGQSQWSFNLKAAN